MSDKKPTFKPTGYGMRGQTASTPYKKTSLAKAKAGRSKMKGPDLPKPKKGARPKRVY